jgi:hypothetical protein
MWITTTRNSHHWTLHDFIIRAANLLIFNGYRDPFPGMKRPDREVNYSPPYSAILEISGALPLLPPLCFHGVDKEIFYLYLLTLMLRRLPWALLPIQTCYCISQFKLVIVLTCICLRRGLFRMTLGTVPHHTWRHTGAGHCSLLIRISCINVILHTRYVSTYVGAGCGRCRGTKKTKAIRCGACYYSIVLNAHRVTSMVDTDTDALRKQKKAEYDKQYRLKRKLLLQQQGSKDIYMIRYFHL